ncbi:hypothetical protein F9C07_2278199 [Aspergillus flavus]|uniref:Uncharacterized protein n=1 Tax=Aspergillus flavus (strain ATCC 200026 / FGSC A1120 / IAM 13836 / NRRL 3357 / JCM 12722 / SRRC 167) TaxID=332952 RepID=A0A7U2MG33_ASPFN|nr:hypothetical protein AFLA_000496 [Aspergillus flavus NRRL3357]QRD83046.1 hypothetical protein F9C07_2278199 [Aspergillus flavus]
MRTAYKNQLPTSLQLQRRRTKSGKQKKETYNSISVVVATRSCVGLLPYLVFHQGKIFGLERSRWLYEVVTGGKNKPFVSSEGDVTVAYLFEHGITLVAWDIEASSVDSSVPFTKLPRSITRNYRPETDIPFSNYIPPEDRSDTEDNRWWSAQIRSGNAVRFFYEWALASENRRHAYLMDSCGVHPVNFPNPFLCRCPIVGWHPPTGGRWDVSFFLEPEKQNTSPFPHIAVGASQPVDATDNSILYGELAVIITVMNSRAKQPQAQSEEEMESLFDMVEEEVEKTFQKSPAFANEQTFPVLLFSFVGPQHARILCASMNQRQLIVRMSRLYSFERKEEAPLDLFTSWLFSRPVVET